MSDEPLQPKRPRHGPLAASRRVRRRWVVRLTAAGTLFVEEFLRANPEPWRLAYHRPRLARLRRLVKSGVVAMDDVRSAAARAVWNAAVKYPGPGRPTLPWVVWCVELSLRKLASRVPRRTVVVRTLSAPEPTGEDVQTDHLEVQRLRRSMDWIHPALREAVERYYNLNGHGRNDRGYRGVAEAMGLNEERAKVLVASGVAELREFMGGYQ